MKRKTTNSPYPILYPGGEEFLPEQGYQNALFDVAGDPDVSVNPATHNIWIQFDFDLQEPTLNEMVENGDANYYVNVECGRTYYRKAVVQSDKHFELEIPYLEISDSLEIFCGVTAARDIQGFHAPGFANKFGNARFDLEQGDILAAATGWNVDLEEVDGDVNPYIYVARDDAEEAHNELWVDGSGNELVIHLAKDVYDIYYGRARDLRFKDLIVALVIKPAILAALQTEILHAGYPERNIDTQGKRWLRKVDGLIARVMAKEQFAWDINATKIDEDRSSHTLAFAVSKLLGGSLAKAMGKLHKM